MPIVRDAAGVEANDQNVVELVGKYSITDLGRHKMAYTKPDGSTGMTSKLVKVGLDGDVWVSVGARPAEEMEALKGKVVVATGKLLAHPPRKSGPGAAPDPVPTLVEVKSVVEFTPK